MLGILLQTFSQVVIVAEYYVQKDYIAKNLCENRNKPKMHCDGKCCLKKKLAKQGREQAPSPRSQKSEVNTLFYNLAGFEIVRAGIQTPPKKYFSYNELYTASFHHAVFHPPTA